MTQESTVSPTVPGLVRIDFEESPEDMIPTNPGTTTTTPDGRTRVSGMVMEGRHESNIPHLVGTERLQGGTDFGPDGRGTMWLWWTIETRDAPDASGRPNGGGWEGVWFGDLTDFGANGTGRGFGLGTGIYEGGRYFSEGTFVDGRGTATGYILLPA